jgi:voltage-gated potassium channel
MRLRVWKILEVSRGGDALSKAIDVFILSLIFLNVLAHIIESVDWIREAYGKEFAYFEVFSLVVFTIEYFTRVWACTADERYSHPLWGRLRYVRTPMAIIDLIVILPFFNMILHLWNIGFDMRVMRSLRLLRVLQLAKTTRYSKSLQLLGRVIYQKREELFLTTGITLILLVMSSTLMFYVENEAQPDQFTDIPSAMWWGVATLTTVGYGDISPITPLGKMIGAIVAMLGIGLFALPAGLLGSGFMDELDRQREAAQPKSCPHCGKAL